ncbi:hypothetical protein QOZ80_6AG0530030 [Eleusine coracana subsp. coracana]|nr:hypothetical protein QOZ80_6AG0530030 [Eleusine coracana subsp. coracana]
MAGGGGGEVVVELEDAVKLLVEHLVQPVLPRSSIRPVAALAPEKQEAVARQVHAAVLLYNYYHRKQFPQLDFADPKRFSVSASLAAGEALLVYLNQVHDRASNGGEGTALSVTDKAIVEACGIAEALDPKVDFPEMTMWPISKVAVLLVDPTRKRCLIENGAVTKGVWSVPEKDVTKASGSSPKAELPSSDALPSEPYLLQQTAFSLVESKSGIKRTNLRFLEEHLVYSLSKKETTAKLFVVQYEQTVNTSLKEVPLEHLISRMSGPIFKSDPYPTTTSVVEFYHILPYKEVLLNLNRESFLDSKQHVPKDKPFRKEKSSLHSEIDELKGQEANSKSNTKKITPGASDPKNKLVVKEEGNNDTNNGSASKNRKHSNSNSKRKSEALKTSPDTYTENQDGEDPRKGNGSLSTPDVETLKFVSNSANAEATLVMSGGFVDLQTSVQKDKDRTEKHNVPEVDSIVKNHASERQIVKATEISGSITDDINDQIYASLQSLQKMRDNILREQCMLGDRSAQFDMDIQTILTEGKMTPRVMTILKRYENNSSNEIKVASPTNSGEGSQTMNMKRKRLTEAILLRNKCQELDEICRENNWILPRYTVLPSVINGLYQARVHLICPDLEMTADGDMKTTPREARDSAATNMLYQLHMKAKEKHAEQGSSPAP